MLHPAPQKATTVKARKQGVATAVNPAPKWCGVHDCLDGAGYWIVRWSALLFQRLPLETALFLGRRLAAIVYFFATKRHRIAYVNLKRAFPQSTAPQRKRWTKGMFRELGMSAVEMMRSPILTKQDAERYTTLHNYKSYLEKRSGGKGVILLTAHMGNWELSQIYEGLRGRPLTVLARRQKYRRLNELLNVFRQYHGSVSVGKGGGIRDLIRTLRQQGSVGMLGDQSGGDEGVWIRFFGRLTTSPRGPMALALKLGVTLIPVFFIRRQGPYHDLIFEPSFELVHTGDLEKDIEVNTQNYIHLLESYLTKYPTQWLWGHKRWKRTRTKHLVILSDGKAGHLKQSETLAKEIIARESRKKPPFEMSVETIEIRFRNRWSKNLLPFFAFFFIPWAQGCLGWLRFFLAPESLERLRRTGPDIIVSAGAGLVPLNLCLARENLAKSAILMKPSFPFNLFRYDLALVPAHDRGILPHGHFRIQGALSGMDSEMLEASGKLLARSISNPEKVRLGLFLGGETRNFRFSLAKVEELLAELERASEKLGGGYLVTTSRRTPASVSQFLRSQIGSYPRCQLCVIASEDPRPEVVPGMMALAEFLIVTEDSLSMISEALSSGKRVVLVKMSSSGLAKKHYRFHENLAREWGIPVVEAGRLSEALDNGEISSSRHRFDEERAKIREKLETLF